MRAGSIRLRWWLAVAISILVALGIAGVGLRYLFERHVEGELTVDLNQLISASLFVDGKLAVATVLTDPALCRARALVYFVGG